MVHADNIIFPEGSGASSKNIGKAIFENRTVWDLVYYDELG